MEHVVITSLQNPKVKQVVGLRDRRERERSGLFAVEGYAELAHAIKSGARPTTLFYCPELFGSQEQEALVDHILALGVRSFEVDQRVFQRIAYREGPDGWIATFPILRPTLDEIRLGESPLVIVAESIEKPGNLGAILRTADAAGVDAVIAAAPITDWSNPNIVRASKGALFSVQHTAADTARTLAWLRDRGIAIVAATPQASAVYTAVDLRGPIAIAVGAEQNGLTSAWLDAADIQVTIPMVGQINSLNVATATALLTYEAFRQRSNSDT